MKKKPMLKKRAGTIVTAALLLVIFAAGAPAFAETLKIGWSTYLGGGQNDFGEAIRAMATDASGSVYLTGETYSADFPVTSGAIQNAIDGASDVFVARLNSTGTELDYSTFFGGQGIDSGTGIAVDAGGRVFITGYTQSSDFPVLSENSFDDTHHGGYDVFVSKFSPNGGQLLYSTFLGGSSSEYAYGICLDLAGDVYVTGYTQSGGDLQGKGRFPVTSGAYGETYSGAYDVFVTKLHPAGKGPEGLLYSTFLGGSSSEYGYGIGIDSAGNVYVTGRTLSGNFPFTTGAYQESLQGSFDVFLVKLNPGGFLPEEQLLYSTFLGGSGNDYGRTLAIDSSGACAIVGYTDSSNFPAQNAFDSTYNGTTPGDLDVFVAKLLPAGNGFEDLKYSSYLGGTLEERGRGVAVDDIDGSIYVTGWTFSGKNEGFPVTSGTLDDIHNGGTDVFLAKINPAGSGSSSLEYCTFLGGLDFDYGEVVTVRSEGRIYLAGYAASEDFPTTPGVCDQSFNGGWDVFVLRLVETEHNGPPHAVAKVNGDVTATLEVDEEATFSGSESSDPDQDPLTFAWDFGDGAVLAGETMIHAYAKPGAYTATLTVSDGVATDEAAVAVTVIVPGEVYYVDGENGSDDNDGTTLETAWLTIHKAAATMQAGDTTYIRGGTYDISALGEIVPAGSGRARAYITFANYNGEEVIVEGGGIDRGFFLSYLPPEPLVPHAYIRIVGLKLQNFSLGGIRIEKAAGVDPPHHIEVRDCVIENCGGAGIKVHGAHDLILAALELKDSGRGIELAVVGRDNDYNIQIIDSVFSGMTGEAADGVVAKAEYSGGAWQNWCENIYLTGCEAFQCQDDGFDLFGRYFTLEHCIAHDISAPPGAPPPYDEDGHGFKIYALDLPVDAGGYHADLYRCLTYRNNREGYKLTSLTMEDSSENVKKFRMLNCTAANDDYGATVVTNETHPMDTEIKNCLFSSRNLDPLDPDGDDFSRALDITGSPVIWMEGGSPVNGTPAYLTLNSDYNLWYSLDENGGLLEPISYLGALYTDGQINSDAYFDITGADGNSLSAPPQFIDENGNDYGLEPGSPAIDAGLDLGLPFAGMAPDLGARESGMMEENSPLGYLEPGENWISIPLAAINDGPYAVFADLGQAVYHRLYRYDPTSARFVRYPSYQSDPAVFGRIQPGAAYNLELAGAAVPDRLRVSGVEVMKTQNLVVSGSGMRNFYFGCPFLEEIIWSACRIENGGRTRSPAQAITSGWIGRVEHFDPVTRNWVPIGSGDVLKPWHAYRLQALTANEMKLIIPSPHTVSGTVTIVSPGWTRNAIELNYQLRPPGTLDEPDYEGKITVTVTPGNPAVGSFVISAIFDGTYDVALKHVNHVADMAPDVEVKGAASGLDLVLWAGDADGDQNAGTVKTLTDGDAAGDNDVDLKDYYTLYYQYRGARPVTSGYNADFDGNGVINVHDYYGLYYGYLNHRRPNNWHK